MRPHHVSPYPAAGEIIDGKYQILQMLGEGGMGAVAKAQHLLRRAPVALKFMAPHVLTIPGAVERFLNEGVAASQIENQHVVTVFDVGKLPTGAPYLVMEFLDGRDLAHLIETEGQRGIDVPRAVHFVLQILRALQSAHAVGIIHRDLKPSNAFIIRKDGERDFVKLVDFGISKVSQPGQASLTQTNSALGTPLYMSPEQAKSPRDVDLRSDLYSVGCILYELLTGHTPHTSESGELTEILFKLFTQDPTPIQNLRQDLPAGLAEVVHKGLARERDNRYSTALEFAEGLAPFADERSAQVISRIRAPVEHRSEPPPMNSIPAPVASIQQAFSQLNSQQFPRITPSAIPGPPPGYGPVTPVSVPAPGHHHATPAEVVARTQALPGSTPQTAKPGVALAGTQSAASTGMGVVSDSATKPKAKTPWPLFLSLSLVVIGVAGYFATRTPPTTPTAPTADSTIAATRPPPTTDPVVTAPTTAIVTPPPTPSASASASAAPSATAAKKPPTSSAPSGAKTKDPLNQLQGIGPGPQR
ncbi:MAG: serine/threonine-protein kinase [Polyangiaceae bacterium]